MRPKIVTPTVITHIQDVIATTETPSWINSVPGNYGEASAGSLKADEWRTLGTIYLPIALISLWGAKPKSSTDSREEILARQLLTHTMHLVCAVILAMKNTTNKGRMVAYRDNIVAYIKALGDLFPGVDPRTNHHVAIHIYDFLNLFGPVKSWWCFPFERLIGFLQRIPHNHIIGM